MANSIDFFTLGATSTRASVDPHEALQRMELKSKRELFQQKLFEIGVEVVDEKITDLYDIDRYFTRARRGSWSVALLEVPNWIIDDGIKGQAIDALRHAFRRETVRFVARDVDLPALAVRRVFRTWKKSDQIDAQLIPWSDLCDAGAKPREVLSIDSIPGTDAVASAPSTKSPARERVFISYSHVDQEWYRRVELQLKAFDKRIDPWSDEKIPAGSDWFPGIQDALDRSKAAVLIVTPNFAASDFVKEHEVPKILEMADRGDLALFWIHASPSQYQELGLADKQSPHDVSKPLDGLTKAKRRAVLKDIADQIVACLGSGPSGG